MENKNSGNRTVWLITGVLAGLCISYFAPHEPAMAASTDRNNKFAMTTCYVSPDLEAVFILDFLTGRLTGAVMNRQGSQFVAAYTRNVAQDFEVEEGTEYAISCGRAQIQGRAGNQYGDSIIYIAELTSGKVAAYAVPYKLYNRRIPNPMNLIRIDQFPFREAIQEK